MPSHISAGPPWPVRFAFFASAIFLSASGATNLLYGWQKGSDLATSCVWAAVSLGVSILFALSWPALLRSIDAKQWARAAMIGIGLLLSGGYSITAALGSASGGRTNAAAIESAAASDRARAQAEYDGAKGELAKLQPSRPLAEMQALVDAARPRCRIIVESGRRETQCAKPADLTAELGRSQRRAELELRVESASAKLERARPTKQANSDTAALVGYLDAVGITATAETVNRWLVILSVLAIEMGGGLSLAVGMALSASEEPAGRHEARSQVELSTADRITAQVAQAGGVFSPPEQRPNTRSFARTPIDRTPEHPAPNTSQNTSISGPNTAFTRQNNPPLPGPNADALSDAGVRLLAFVRGRGDVLVSGQRQIGKAMGWSTSWTHAVLHSLADAGQVRLTTGRQGTVVQLPAA